MRTQSLAFGTALVAAVAASPNPLAKRTVVNDPNGNIKLTFSDKKVKIGSVKIDDIIHELSIACSTQGQCATSPLEFDGKKSSGNILQEITVTVGPSGAYPTWIHNGLIDGLAAAVHAIAECKSIDRLRCAPNWDLCGDDPSTYKFEECTVPAYWGINFQDPDATDSAPPFIGADVVMKVHEDGFCKIFTTIMGALAGAIHGVGGGIFALSSLACKE